jgi:aspartate aminotransferase-like enzyme
MVVAGGQDHLKGKISRVGHLGQYDLFDIISICTALEECANPLGHKAEGAATAARKAWDNA